MSKDILTLDDFKTMVENNSDIINENNLTNNNLAEFLSNKITYIISKDDHKVNLIKNLKIRGKYTPIDVNLTELILYLNEKGYYTDWCCEGNEKNGNGYISFTNGLNGVTISDEKYIKLIDSISLLVIECPLCYIDTRGMCLTIRWKQNNKEEKNTVLKSLYKILMVLK